MTKSNIFDFLFILFIFLFDRITKILIIEISDNSEKVLIEITSFLNFNLIWNDGIAFGLFSFSDKFFYNLLTALIILIVILIFFVMVKSEGREKIGFMMVLGGSLGNLFDRLFYSSVPDFIDLHYNNFNWFIFNVADIFITLGILLLIYLEFFKKENV